ncbi:hypothetical protein [Noviherbaspirillum malthae]|uniref:hypothetical protein n=1 Tax=Noviherbaspirillum malthae TaxID=1260987 RepID=UPI0018909BAB|nr:hypothetical protein [Noviherbaspirillum malthae]
MGKENKTDVQRLCLPENLKPFREKHRLLFASYAADETSIHKALLTRKFTIVLDALTEYGLARLAQEGQVVQAENDPLGYEQACAEHRGWRKSRRESSSRQCTAGSAPVRRQNEPAAVVVTKSGTS